MVNFQKIYYLMVTFDYKIFYTDQFGLNYFCLILSNLLFVFKIIWIT